ncbi:MAG: hypothetical protein IJT43_02880 [Stomatobaculum sp.]|nr:hypothetical protein [Stomatobaculum sp.]
MNRKRIRGAALFLILMLLAAGCGGKTEKPAETSAAIQSDGTADAPQSEGASGDTGDSTAEAGTEAEASGQGTDNSSGEISEESTAEPPALVVTKHKEDGTHMVTAGSLTISVPTTFEGLEMEGAEFQGDEELVLSGKTGTARVKYKNGFGSIRIKVKNNTEYDMAVRECTIIGIEIGSTDPDPELMLYGIPMGATRQEIADVYGEPFSKTFDDENHLSNMVYQFGTDIHSNQVVMIIFRDKKAVAASYEDFSLVRRKE